MVKNDKGAASVLVIVMMLVLVVFGLAMVTTALAQIRLSDTHDQWVSDYYDLETEAQEQIYKIDKILHQSEMETLNYLKVGSILSEDYDGPVDGHEWYYEGLMNEASRNAKSNYINEIMTDIYMDQVIIHLEDYVADNEDVTYKISQGHDGNYTVHISGYVTNTDENYKKNIAFEMVSLMPRYVLSYDGVRIDGFKDMTVSDRYVLTAYEQYQEPVIMEETIEFGNPFENPEGESLEDPFGEEGLTEDPFDNPLEDPMEEEIIEEP